ncbi:FtsL-like putative cell division protein [Sodaliphilus sp.]|uniref:FtsL-like putative cell division protein n=1 Tax=Sodaliphilus sp. TaxID=2815818 RepID=UPI00388EB6B6
METEKKQNKKKASLWSMARDMRKGRFLSVEFFKKNLVYIVFIMGMIVMSIANKYKCMTYKDEVMSLEKQRASIETDWVNSKAKYNSMTRESQMTTLMDSMRLDLTSPEQPPYILSTK